MNRFTTFHSLLLFMMVWPAMIVTNQGLKKIPIESHNNPSELLERITPQLVSNFLTRYRFSFMLDEDRWHTLDDDLDFRDLLSKPENYAIVQAEDDQKIRDAIIQGHIPIQTIKDANYVYDQESKALIFIGSSMNLDKDILTSLFLGYPDNLEQNIWTLGGLTRLIIFELNGKQYVSIFPAVAYETNGWYRTLQIESPEGIGSIKTGIELQQNPQHGGFPVAEVERILELLPAADEDTEDTSPLESLRDQVKIEPVLYTAENRDEVFKAKVLLEKNRRTGTTFIEIIVALILAVSLILGTLKFGGGWVVISVGAVLFTTEVWRRIYNLEAVDWTPAVLDEQPPHAENVLGRLSLQPLKVGVTTQLLERNPYDVYFIDSSMAGSLEEFLNERQRSKRKSILIPQTPELLDQIGRLVKPSQKIRIAPGMDYSTQGQYDLAVLETMPLFQKLGKDGSRLNIYYNPQTTTLDPAHLNLETSIFSQQGSAYIQISAAFEILGRFVVPTLTQKIYGQLKALIAA